MKILYFHQYFGTPQGSWSTRAYEWTRRWAAEGDDVTVVTSVYDLSDLKAKGLVSKFEIDGVDVRMLNITQSSKHSVLRKFCTFAVFALVSSWYALTVKADVVIVSSGPITVGIPGLIARYLRRTPLVFEARDLWPEGAIQLGIVRNPLMIRMARCFERMCYRAASSVVFASDGQADWIRNQYGFTHLDVVTNISDNELADRVAGTLQLPEWAEGKRLVLFTGTLGLIHDCSQLLDVAEVLQKRSEDDFLIVIVGDGAERPQLEQRAKDTQLKNVRFLGRVTKETAMSWLTEAHCLLSTVKDVPFLATASPIKLFDSFAAATPVVQTTQGWMKDLLEREECGLTVPQGDPEAMADAIVRLQREPGLRDKLSGNAKRVAVNLFDRNVLADKMRAIVANAAGGRKATDAHTESTETSDAESSDVERLTAT